VRVFYASSHFEKIEELKKEREDVSLLLPALVPSFKKKK
jgi:hypothetical protein